MTQIVDYASLQTEVGNWLHRADLVAEIPAFIALAEDIMSADLDTRPMQTRTTLTTVGGNAYVSLPNDLLETVRLKIVGDPLSVLKYCSPDELDADFPSASTEQPVAFTVIGSQVQLAPIPDSAYSMELTYKQKVPSLSASNTTNWVITMFPNVYLFGALVCAMIYTENDERGQIFNAMYRKAVDAANSIDWYSGSTMRIRAR